MQRTLSALMGIAFVLCGSTHAEMTQGEGTLPPEVSALEAHQLMVREGALLVDVRTPEEWTETGVAEGAWRITLDDPDFTAKVAALLDHDTSAEVAFICHSGNRSQAARDRLVAAGYANATSVRAGTVTPGGWISSGLPVVAVADLACEQPAGQC